MVLVFLSPAIMLLLCDWVCLKFFGVVCLNTTQALVYLLCLLWAGGADCVWASFGRSVWNGFEVSALSLVRVRPLLRPLLTVLAARGAAAGGSCGPGGRATGAADGRTGA